MTNKVGRPRTFHDYQVTTTVKREIKALIEARAAKDGTSQYVALRNILNDWAVDKE